ncbi:ligand-gated chloride channel [Aphelenchoides avenae]|nr:ligand-gated chloride channel [Aphelenchus avenae]
MTCCQTPSTSQEAGSSPCEKCDLRSSYCKKWTETNVTCECRAGFVRRASGQCVLKGTTGQETTELEDSEECVLGQAEKHATRILTDILKRYDRNMVPSMKGVDVDVELLIQKISEINEIQSSSKMDILFSQIWHDPGLDFQEEEGAQCLTNLSLSHRMVESIWIPNVCLVNSKASSIHSSPTPNIFLAIFPNGTVWMNYRIVVESPCDFEFTTFPMDKVECMTVFESYSFNVGKVRLHWKRQGIPVEIIGNIQLPDFVMTHYIHEKATFHYPAGVWDQVSYVKGVDLFMFGCVAYIILSVIELAMVGMLEKESNSFGRRRKFTDGGQGPFQPSHYDDGELERTDSIAKKAFGRASDENRKTTSPKRARVKVEGPRLFHKWTGEDLDRFCQKAFPLSFALLNLAYWMWISAKSQDTPH